MGLVIHSPDLVEFLPSSSSLVVPLGVSVGDLSKSFVLSVIVIVNPNKSVIFSSIKLKYLRVKDDIFCFFDFAFTPKTHVKNQHKNWKYGDAFSCVIICSIPLPLPLSNFNISVTVLAGSLAVVHLNNIPINSEIKSLKVVPVDAVDSFSYKSNKPETILCGRVLDIVL